MTKSELKQKWDEVLQIMSDNLGKLPVNTFFGSLVPLRLNDKEETIVMMSVANPVFCSNKIKEHSGTLNDAILKVFGKNYKIDISGNEDGSEENDEILSDSQLNPKYTFDTFVTGNNCSLAYSASRSVAEKYDDKLNPLFLYGGPGLGKTHLMHAIGQFVLKKNPKKKVLYVSAETFTNDYTQNLQYHTQNSFRKKYRNVDYLLFDDVQFIAGKAATTEELFNTFNELKANGKQIVFCSDKPPRELGDIPERMVQRFSWGLIADIQTPDYETRMAILKNKAMIEGLDADDPDLLSALETIAVAIESNIRELESAFTRVYTFSNLSKERITSSFVKKVLSELYNTKTKEVSPEDIKKAVAKYYSIKVSDMESSSRSRDIAYPRQIAIFMIREKLNFSLPKIGEFFGGRDHTTILSSYNKIKDEINKNKETMEIIDNIYKLI